MWFYDDKREAYSRQCDDDSEDHDGFPDVVADSIYAIGSAIVCAAVTVCAWLYKTGGYLPWQ
jgi:hypothetical protein